MVPTSLAGALCGRDSSRLVAVGDSSAPRAPGESGIRGVVIAHNYAVRVPLENGSMFWKMSPYYASRRVLIVIFPLPRSK